ncbi:hypothetical protein TNCV_4124921 [Trichonephila clavipes]|nr:hypothetical protein TNCV_4124921 [Trichonephila clavipes]
MDIMKDEYGDFPILSNDESSKVERGEGDQISSSISKQSGIVNFIKIQRIKWADHDVRTDEDRTTKKLFNAQPIGT